MRYRCHVAWPSTGRTITIDELVRVGHIGMKAALLAVAAMDDGSTVSNVLLARWLRSVNEYPVDGLFLQYEGVNSAGSQLWTLRAVTARSRTPEG